MVEVLALLTLTLGLIPYMLQSVEPVLGVPCIAMAGTLLKWCKTGLTHSITVTQYCATHGDIGCLVKQ